MANLIEALEKAFVKLRRKRVSRTLFHKYGGVVQRGPLKGLSLSGESNISQGPLALKIFGLYEQSVIKKIVANGPYRDVVNIGAADGYFSLGLLKSSLAKRSICFEMTEEGREAIKSNAARNDLSNQIVVFGKADQNIKTFLDKASFNPSNSLFLCDIEGGEFSLFTPEMFEALAGSMIIIELHDRIQNGVPDQRHLIIDNIPAQLNYEIIRSTPPEWSGIEDIEALSDNDRAVVMSEGRKAIGEWLVISPG